MYRRRSKSTQNTHTSMAMAMAMVKPHDIKHAYNFEDSKVSSFWGEIVNVLQQFANISIRILGYVSIICMMWSEYRNKLWEHITTLYVSIIWNSYIYLRMGTDIL